MQNLKLSCVRNLYRKISMIFTKSCFIILCASSLNQITKLYLFGLSFVYSFILSAVLASIVKNNFWVFGAAFQKLLKMLKYSKNLCYSGITLLFI